MPMVIPVVASFAAAGSAIAAAGGVVAAMSTFSGFLAVAGAALTGIGALTGKKDLIKVGSLMTLGSSLAGAMGNAGTTAAGEAAAEEAASSAAGDTFGTAFDAEAAAAAEGTVTPTTAGMEQATAQAANAGTSASEVIDPMERANQLYESGQSNASIFDRAAAGTNASPMASSAAEPSILERLSASAPQDGSSMLADINSQALQPGIDASASQSMPSGATINGRVMSTGPTDAVAQGARSMTSDQVTSLVDRGMRRTGSMLNNVGQWVRDNKELAQIGGQMLSSLYDPRADALEFEQSIYNRRRRNLNNPVALTFGAT